LGGGEYGRQPFLKADAGDRFRNQGIARHRGILNCLQLRCFLKPEEAGDLTWRVNFLATRVRDRVILPGLQIRRGSLGCC
jgi:hypothetical protein